MQISSIPLKWTLPFAANDSAKVEIPATTADPSRFSLSLGSPPLTGQPPETGGVPPQLEDFNGAMNQISRITWWAMGGGPFPFDATWSSNVNVNGYPQGGKIRTADLQGDWLSLVDNNITNPDTVGTGWVPGYNYGTTALTGQTGGTTTLTPAQAVKRTFSIAGTLTSNLTIVLPTWLQEWTVTNTTTGAFTVTVKTAAGSGVLIPQNSAPTRVRGDGTNITQLSENIAPAMQATQAVRLGQLTGLVGAARLVKMTITAAAASATLTADQVVVGTALNGVQYLLPSFNQTINLATTGAGGMDVGTAPVSGYVAVYAIYNPTTAAVALLATNATSAPAPTVYGGANMPSGYTASALVSVWPTNGSGQLVVGLQNDRRITGLLSTVLSTSTPAPSLTALSIASAVPPNARWIRGTTNIQNATTTATAVAINVAASAAGLGQQYNQGYLSTTSQLVQNFTIDLQTAQQIYYLATTTPNVSATYNIYITAYEI